MVQIIPIHKFLTFLFTKCLLQSYAYLLHFICMQKPDWQSPVMKTNIADLYSSRSSVFNGKDDFNIHERLNR